MPESTTDRIARIKEEILSSHKSNLNSKLEDVLSICDSEIERLMILQLYNYFAEYDSTKYDDGLFTDIEFIIHQFIPNMPDEEVWDKITNMYLRNVYKHNYEAPYYSKYIGFTSTYKWSEGVTLEDLNSGEFDYLDDLITHVFEVRPQQYGHVIGGIRVDIAIILKRIKHNEVISTKKIAIECDGRDYHSTEQQIRNDKERAADLLANGWNDVIRFSGSEIYRINDDFNKIHFKFEDFIKILMQ